MLGDSIVMPYVFREYQVLDDGPLRFTVHLINNKVRVNGEEIEEHRLIRLDKQSNFNRMTVWYDGLTKPVSFCSGVVIQREDPEPVVFSPQRTFESEKLLFLVFVTAIDSILSRSCLSAATSRASLRRISESRGL